MFAQIRGRLLPFGLLVLPLVGGCQTGSARYSGESAVPADPLGWFWTALIAGLTLIIGFLVGATMSRNGGIHLSTHRHHRHRRTQTGWDRLARHIQEGTNRGLTDWRSAGHAGQAEELDWNELRHAIEERILEELHKHHD